MLKQYLTPIAKLSHLPTTVGEILKTADNKKNDVEFKNFG